MGKDRFERSKIDNIAVFIGILKNIISNILYKFTLGINYFYRKNFT